MRSILSAILLVLLYPLHFYGQDQKFEINLDRVRELVDSAQYDKAITLSRDIHLDFLSDTVANDSTEAKIYNAMSSVFVKTAQVDSSMFYANKALAILKKMGNSPIEESKAHNYIGTCYNLTGEFDKAIKSFKSGLEIVKHAFGDHHFEATIFYGNLSLCYNSIGEPEIAIDYLDKNLDILLDLFGENHINIAKTYNNLGAVYYNIGDYDKVLSFSFKTLKIKQQLLGDHHPSVGSTYVNIGSMYKEKGDYEKSKSYVEKGILILKKTLGDTHPFLTYSHKILGSCYLNTNKYDQAITHYEKGINIIQSNFGKDHYRAAGIYFDLGKLYSKLKNYEESKKYITKAKHIFYQNKGSKNKDVAACNELLGEVYISEMKYDKAIALFNESLLFYNSKSLKGPDRALPYMNIAIVHCYKNDFPKANSYFNKSAQALQYDFNHPMSFERVTNRIVLRRLLNQKRKYYEILFHSSRSKKYRDSIKQNDLHALALEDFFHTELVDQEARSFHASDAFWRYEVAIKNLVTNLSKENLNIAFEVAEKSKNRLLAENFRTVEARKIAGIPQNLLDEEYQLNIDLTYYEKKRFQEKYEKESPNDSLIRGFTSQLFEIGQRKEQLIQTFKDKYPTYHRLKYDYKVSNIADVQSIIEPDQALVEYFVGDSTIFIFVINPDSTYIRSIDIDFPLEDWVEILRENIFSYWMIGDQNDEVYQNQNLAYAKVAYQVYEKLIAPIQNLLPEKLIIVPDGVLNFIPFEALLENHPDESIDYKNYPYLLKRYQISYTYSATLLKELISQKKEKLNKPLAVFAPSFKDDTSTYNTIQEVRNGFGHLKYNTIEAENIHSILGGDLFVGNRATEDQFINLTNQYQIIHLSTHGKSNDQMGDYSYIGFTEIQDSVSDNERLYVRELYNMHLDADMVVLSACETGLGEMKRGEGIIGLARGFTFAGAASTVTSLWSVNDIQTSQLMTRFYKNIKAGMTKDAALRQAKLSYLKEENHADPYFWSAFIAAGNMAPIDLHENQPWWYYALCIIGLGGLLIIIGKRVMRLEIGEIGDWRD